MSANAPEPDHEPRWLPEHAASFPARLWRCATLTPRLWRPQRLWRRIDRATPVSISALCGFLLVVVIARLLMGGAGALDIIAFTISPPSPGWGADDAAIAREVAFPAFASKTGNDGVLDPAWLAGPLAGHTVFMLLLLGLAKDRRKAGVSAPHVLRAWIYGLAWLVALFLFCALAGAIDAFAYARWVYSDFEKDRDTLETVARGLVHATESPILLAVIAVWILLWWRGAIVTAWRVPRGQAGWLLLSLVALVVGAGAVMLTDHIHTLRVIAAG